MSIGKATDHWAFLEEIEAPMWADLGLEEKLNDQDIDGDWFHRGHKFHQCSSHELKSFFSCSGFRSLGVSSPTLPPSVSRSRGSDYKNKKWGRSNCDVPFMKQQLVKDSNEISSEVYSGSGEKLKAGLNFLSLKATSASSSNTSCISTISGDAKGTRNHLKPETTCRASGKFVNHFGVKSVGNNMVNIGTSGAHQQQHKTSSEVTSSTFGRKSVLESAVEITVRSFAARQALRAETNNNSKESRGRKSSSSKSSVGSSSLPGSSLKFSVAGSMMKGQAPDSSSAAKITEAAKDRKKVSVTYKASNVQVKGRTLSSERKVLANITNQTSCKASKPKVQPQTFPSKVTAPLHVENQSFSAASTKDRKLAANKLNQAVAVNEGVTSNAINRLAWNGKGAAKSEPCKIGSRVQLVGRKVKVGSQNEARNSAYQRLYLR